jgi:hypothetical protein
MPGLKFFYANKETILKIFYAKKETILKMFAKYKNITTNVRKRVNFYIILFN